MSRITSQGRNVHRPHPAFTLIELLVVMGVITLLIAILLPVLASARQAGQRTQCAANMRQLALALSNYAADNHGKYPPNRGADHQLWYTQATIGKYIRSSGVSELSDGTMAGGVLVCPNDRAGAMRSYSMNIWASSVVSDMVAQSQSETPPHGRLFDSGTRGGERLILLAESFWEDPTENTLGVNSSPAVVGWVGHPGERFGGSTSSFCVVLIKYGIVDCQLNYSRHRTLSQRGQRVGKALGSLHLAFADGHVQQYRPDELVDFATGKSRYAALWSPIDRQCE